MTQKPQQLAAKHVSVDIKRYGNSRAYRREMVRVIKATAQRGQAVLLDPVGEASQVSDQVVATWLGRDLVRAGVPESLILR